MSDKTISQLQEATSVSDDDLTIIVQNGVTKKAKASKIKGVSSGVSGILKADGSGNVSSANAGTDYLTPTGNGSGLTGLTAAQVGKPATVTIAPYGATYKADYYAGASDASDAFQSAINLIKSSGKGGKILIFEGVYPFTGTVDCTDTNSIVIEGMSPAGMWGSYGTVLVQSSDVKMFSFVHGTSDPKAVHFKNIHFKSDPSKTQPVLYYQNCHNMTREACYFETCPQAIYAERPWDFWDLYNNFRDCGTGNSVNTSSIGIYNGATDNCSGWKFIGCRWESMPGASVYSDSTGGTGRRNNNISFIDCKFEGSSGKGYPALSGNLIMSRMVGCYMYWSDPSYNIINIVADNMTIDSNHFQGHNNTAIVILGTGNTIALNKLIYPNSAIAESIKILSGSSKNKVIGNTRGHSDTAPVLTDQGTNTIAYMNDGAENVVASSALVTSVGSPGSDSNVPSEKAVRSAITSSGLGDFSSNTTTSVDDEIVLFSGTGGKTGKRASTTGMLKATSGVLSAATSGVDYIVPSGNGSVGGTTDSTGSNLGTTMRVAGATNVYPYINGRAARGTIASPTASQNGDQLFSISAGGHNGAGFQAFQARWDIYTDETWDTSGRGTKMVFSTTPNQSTTLTERMRIDNAGRVGIGFTSGAPTERLEVKGGNIKTDGQIISTVSTGTAPIVLSGNSETKVDHLNADLLDGQHGSYYAPLASPSFTTPTLGVATATSVNKYTFTTPANGSTLTIADGKTFTSSNTITLSGTDGSSLNIGTGGTLNTAAFAASSSFATATQGGLADTALQPNTVITVKGVTEKVGSTGGATPQSITGTYAPDMTSGSTFNVSLSGACTINAPTSVPATGNVCSVTFLINPSTYTATFSAAYKWGDSGAPTLTASKINIVTCFSIDGGTTWMSFLSGTGF